MHKRGITSLELCKNYKDGKFLVVVDHSRGKKNYYTLAAIKRIGQYKLLKYADRFKHVRMSFPLSLLSYLTIDSTFSLSILHQIRI